MWSEWVLMETDLLMMMMRKVCGIILGEVALLSAAGITSCLACFAAATSLEL